MISGSMTHTKDMLELEKSLEIMGHDVVPPVGTDIHLEDPFFQDDLERNLKASIHTDILRKNFDQLAKQDALLVFNKSKNNIKGYMGTAMLMELAVAYFLGKKIFILYDIPHFNDHRWAHEVNIMQPIFLHGDLEKIV